MSNYRDDGSQNREQRQDRKVDEISKADDNKKLFVGGLSWDTTDDHLAEYFGKWGAVECVSVKMDKFSGQSRGFGFVVYVDEGSIDKALKLAEHRLNNKKIDPKRASASKQSMKKVFVGGLDPDVSEDQIREYFGRYGKIETLDLPFDTERGKRKSYIFITYATEDGANEATKVEKQELFGRRCDVRIAVPQEQAQRNKNWQGNQRGGYGRQQDSGYGYGNESYGYGSGGGGGYGSGDHHSSSDGHRQQSNGGGGSGGKMRGRGYGGPTYHPYGQQ